VVTEPTLREVFAATFRDRVVHHLLYNFLEPYFEPVFIAQSYACRKNKGIHQSLKDLRKYLRKTTQNNRLKAYYLHLDIRGFFMSLKKDILYRLIAKRVKNPELLWLARLIIYNNPLENFTSKGDQSLFAKLPPHKSLFHIPKNQGLPIGNLTSQFFANVYLNELDQFAKHGLKAKCYLRYVDDFLLLSRDRLKLLKWRDEIDKFLKERLGLELNRKKQIFLTVDRGVDWLGYFIKPDCILIRRRTVRNFKQKLYSFNLLLKKYPTCAVEAPSQLLLPFPEYHPPLELLQKILATVNSYFGHFSHADTYNLRKHLWENHFLKLKNYLEPKDERFTVLRIKPVYKKAWESRS